MMNRQWRYLGRSPAIALSTHATGVTSPADFSTSGSKTPVRQTMSQILLASHGFKRRPHHPHMPKVREKVPEVSAPALTTALWSNWTNRLRRKECREIVSQYKTR